MIIVLNWSIEHVEGYINMTLTHVIHIKRYTDMALYIAASQEILQKHVTTTLGLGCWIRVRHTYRIKTLNP